MRHVVAPEKGGSMPENINTECKCTYSCGRHGNCKACQEYHRKTGSRTNCGKDGSDSESKKQ